MKIALVFFDLSIPAGGQRQFLSLAQHLVEKGHKVVIYTCKKDLKIFPPLWRNLEVVTVDCSADFRSLWQRVLFFYKRIYRYLYEGKSVAEAMDNDFDAINCHEAFSYYVGYYYKKKKSNTRVVWSLNNVSYFYNPSGTILQKCKSYLLNVYKNFREKPYYQSIDVVAPLSAYEEKWCLDRKLNVKIVRSGLDFETFYKPIKEVTLGQEFTLLSIGALGPHRRFEDTIKAVSVLRAKGHNVKSVIICKKIGNEAEYEKYLADLIEKYDLKQHIQLLKQGATEEEIYRIYNSTHIFVHPVYLPPPQYYGWGLVVFEAMASGLPVVLCSTTGATEVLIDKNTAIFAEPLSAEDFAEKIETLLVDPQYYRFIAQNGQTYVKDNISWDKYTESMLRLLEVK